MLTSVFVCKKLAFLALSFRRALNFGHKSRKWQWRHNFLTWCHRQSFWSCFVCRVNFSYWFKFHVNIITGSRIITIFFYKGLTTNLEIGNTHDWVLPNIGDWDKLGIPNLTKMSLIKCYWMLQYARVTTFTVSELFRENHQGGKINPHPD